MAPATTDSNNGSLSLSDTIHIVVALIIVVAFVIALVLYIKPKISYTLYNMIRAPFTRSGRAPSSIARGGRIDPMASLETFKLKYGQHARTSSQASDCVPTYSRNETPPPRYDAPSPPPPARCPPYERTVDCPSSAAQNASRAGRASVSRNAPMASMSEYRLTRGPSR